MDLRVAEDEVEEVVCKFFQAVHSPVNDHSLFDTSF